MLSNITDMSIYQIIAELIEIPCRIVFLFVLWNRFVPLFSRGSRKDKNKVLVLAMIVTAAEVLRWCMFTDGFPIWMLTLCGIPLLYACLYKRERIPETLFSLILFVNLRYLSFFAVNSIMNAVSKRMMSGVEMAEDVETFVSSRLDILSLLSEGIYIVILLIEILPIIWFVKRPEKMRWMELCYLSVMNIAGIILTRIMMGIAVLDTADGSIILLDEKPQLLWLLPFVAILLYFGELSAILIWQRYCEFRRRSELHLARSLEEEAIRRRLDDTEHYYEQVRKVRHEMANHMTNIRGLAEQGLNEELCRYITDIDDTIRSVEMRYNTGDSVTDVVMNDRYRKAEERGITFSSNFVYKGSWGIPVYDLSIVLSNILDNALKAAEAASAELKYINIKMADKKNVILLVCENGFDPSDKVLKGADDIWHGIGLKNVEDIAERYSGTVNVKKADSVYRISILLKKCPSVT